MAGDVKKDDVAAEVAAVAAGGSGGGTSSTAKAKDKAKQLLASAPLAPEADKSGTMRTHLNYDQFLEEVRRNNISFPAAVCPLPRPAAAAMCTARLPLRSRNGFSILSSFAGLHPRLRLRLWRCLWWWWFGVLMLSSFRPSVHCALVAALLDDCCAFSGAGAPAKIGNL